jgi:hypothetical protein
MAETLNNSWDPVFTRLRAVMTDEGFVALLGELAAAGAFHSRPGGATIIAEDIATLRNIVLWKVSAGVPGGSP